MDTFTVDVLSCIIAVLCVIIGSHGLLLYASCIDNSESLTPGAPYLCQNTRVLSLTYTKCCFEDFCNRYTLPTLMTVTVKEGIPLPCISTMQSKTHHLPYWNLATKYWWSNLIFPYIFVFTKLQLSPFNILLKGAFTYL